MSDKLEIYDSLAACPSCGCLEKIGSSRCPECGCFHAKIELKENVNVTTIHNPPTPKDPSHYSLNPKMEILPDNDDELDVDEDVTRAWSGGATDFSNID